MNDFMQHVYSVWAFILIILYLYQSRKACGIVSARPRALGSPNPSGLTEQRSDYNVTFIFSGNK